MKYIITLLLLIQISFGALADNFLLEDTLGRKIQDAKIQKITAENSVIFYKGESKYELPLEAFSPETQERLTELKNLSVSGLNPNTDWNKILVLDLNETHFTFQYKEEIVTVPNSAIPSKVLDPIKESYAKRAKDLKTWKTIPIKVVTPSDVQLDEWMLDWYNKHFFRHPNMPDKVVKILLGDPALRIEYFDAFTHPEEVKYQYSYKHKSGLFPKEIIKHDKPHGARIALSKMYQDTPNRVIDYTRLALAFSLIYDVPAKNATTLGIFQNVPQNDQDRRTHLNMLFRWKTNTGNQKLFQFSHQDLNMRQMTWANATNQSNDALSWALELGMNPSLNNWYTMIEYKYKLPNNLDIRDYNAGICAHQTYVLNHKLTAFNIPNSYSNRAFNDSDIDTHAYLQVMTPKGFEYAGAWERSYGFTIHPTHLTFMIDGMFNVYLSKEYNKPLRQKLRVKTQWVNTLSEPQKGKVIQEILKESPEYGEALALQKIAYGIEPEAINSKLDHSLYFQNMVWHYAQTGDTEKGIEAFKQLGALESDEAIRLAWAFETLIAIEDIEFNVKLYPELANKAPTYPGSIGIILKNFTDVEEEELRKIVRSIYQEHDRKNYADFDKILLHFAFNTS